MTTDPAALNIVLETTAEVERLRRTVRELYAALKMANTLISCGDITISQVFDAGPAAIEASGLNPWCMNEGLADGSEHIDFGFGWAALHDAERNHPDVV